MMSDRSGRTAGAARGGLKRGAGMANRLRNDRSSSERSRLSAKAGPGVKRLSILLLPACLHRYGELWLGRGRGGRAGRRLVAAGGGGWGGEVTRPGRMLLRQRE